jgi:hypothetical protein
MSLVRAGIVLALLPSLIFPGGSAARAQGLVPEDDAALATVPVAQASRSLTLPPRFLLSGLPLPRSQGRTGTCVAWAVAYAAGTYFHRARLGTSPEAALSPGFAYAVANGDTRCLSGGRISVMLNALRDVGALPLSEYAYDPGWCGRVPTEAERRRAADFRIPGWATVPGGNPALAKAQIAQGSPVIFALQIGRAFNAHRGAAGVFDVLETGEELYGHAMVAVGYDDALQAFRIQNSAGTSWGEDGMAWLSYRVWRERVQTGYVITDQAPPAASGTVSASPPAPAPADAGANAAFDRLAAALPPPLRTVRWIEPWLRVYVTERTKGLK